MTSIEHTGIPRAATAAEHGRPAGEPLSAHDEPGPPLRLALLDAVRGGSATLDGAWWPRSRSLTDELPALIVDLHRRGVRISRVAFRMENWDAAPRRLSADARAIRLGWFQGLDPHLVRLTGGEGGQARLDLLVVPPDTREPVATGAMAAASAPENHGSATAVLIAIGALPTVDHAAVG